MKIRIEITLTVVITAVLFIFSDLTLACRCSPPETLRGYFDRASIVFVGQVVEKSKKLPPLTGETFNHHKVTFKVEKWWKGGDNKEITVIDTEWTCSPMFEVGQRWLIYANGERLKTNVCDGTIRFEVANDHLKVLGTGYLPMNGHSQGNLNSLAQVVSTEHVNGLRLRIYTPTPTYKDFNLFQLSVIFENLGKEKIVILPQSIRRNYQSKGHGAPKYIPFPGPRIYPLKDAFTLLSGQKDAVNFVGMRDGDGIWMLEPGTYDLSIRYTVSQDLVSSYARDLPDSNARIWAGSIESEKITVKFQP